MPKIIKINSTEIGLGEEANISMNIAKLPSRTTVDIPIIIKRAKEDGPVFLLLAGMHGDEINGIEIIRQLMVEQSLKLIRGTIIAIPIINIYGFIHLKRETPDGKDLNRCFPGIENGSLASRIAWFFMKTVMPWVDCGVDFHTGGAMRTNYPQVRCTFNDLNNRELGEAFSAPFLIDSPLRDKTIRKEALKLDKPIIVYEGGESLRMNRNAIKEGVNGTLRLLQHLNMIQPVAKPAQSIVIGSSTWVRARIAGLFIPSVKAGDFVKNKQTIGILTGPYSDFQKKIKAPCDGWVIGLNNLPVVNQGEALFHIGIEEKNN